MLNYIIFQVDEDRDKNELKDMVALSEIDPKVLLKLCKIGFSTFKKNKFCFDEDEYNIQKVQFEILLDELSLLPK